MARIKKKRVDDFNIFIAVALFILFTFIIISNNSGLTSSISLDVNNALISNDSNFEVNINLLENDLLPLNSIISVNVNNLTTTYVVDNYLESLNYERVNMSKRINGTYQFYYENYISKSSDFSSNASFSFDLNNYCFFIDNNSLIYVNDALLTNNTYLNHSCIDNDLINYSINSTDLYNSSFDDNILLINPVYHISYYKMFNNSSFSVPISLDDRNLSNLDVEVSLLSDSNIISSYKTTLNLTSSKINVTINSTLSNLTNSTLNSTNISNSNLTNLTYNSSNTLNNNSIENDSVIQKNVTDTAIPQNVSIQEINDSEIIYHIQSNPTIYNLDSDDPDGVVKYNQLLNFSVNAYHINMSHVSIGYSTFFNMSPNPTNTTWTISKTLVDLGCPTNGSCLVRAIAYDDQLNSNSTTYNLTIDNRKILSCTLRNPSCLPNETAVIRLSNYTNAHGELPSLLNDDYNYTICCQDENYHIGLNVSYNSGEDVLVRLSNITNSHAETKLYNNYANSIYFSAAQADLVLIDIVTGLSCENAGYQACILTLSNQTNAHLASCNNSPYNVKICGALNNNAPHTKLISPNPDLYLNRNFNFTYNVSDVDGLSDIDNCKLYLNTSNSDFSIYDSRSVSSNINYIPYIVGTQSDELQWYVKCTDITGSFSIAGINTFYVDTIDPFLSNFHSSKLNNISRSDSSLTYYVTGSDVYMDTVKINGVLMSNSSDLYSYTGAPSSLGCLSGTCNLVVNATDKANNSKILNYSLIIDDSIPFINFLNSTLVNNTYLSNNNFSVNVNVSDNYFESIYYYLYGSFYNIQDDSQYSTLVTTHNFTNLNDGIYYFKTKVTDSADNSNETELRKIIIDTTSPQINNFYSSDSDNYTRSDLNLTFYANVNDINVDYLEIYNGVNKYNMSYSGSLWAITKTLSDFGCTSNGNCILTLKAFDKANNFETRTYTIDVNNNPPQISSVSPSNSTSLSLPVGTNYYISNHSFKVSTSTSILNCSFYHDANSNSINVINQTIFNPSINTFYSFSINVTTPQQYNWSIICYDELGNSSTTGLYDYNLIVLNPPQSGSSSSSSSGSSSTSSLSSTTQASSLTFTQKTKGDSLVNETVCVPLISYDSWSHCVNNVQFRNKTISGCNRTSTSSQKRFCESNYEDVDDIVNNLESKIDSVDMKSIEEISGKFTDTFEKSLSNIQFLLSDSELKDLGYSSVKIAKTVQELQNYNSKLKELNELYLKYKNNLSLKDEYYFKLNELKLYAKNVSTKLPVTHVGNSNCKTLYQLSSFNVTKCSKNFNFKSYNRTKNVYKTKYDLLITAKEDIYNLSLIENISKDIAKDVGELSFSLTPIIIKQDPIVKFVIPKIKKNDNYVISYYVNKNITSNLKSLTRIESYKSSSSLNIKNPAGFVMTTSLIIAILVFVLILSGAFLELFIESIDKKSKNVSRNMIKLMAYPVMLPYVLLRFIIENFISLVSQFVTVIKNISYTFVSIADKIILLIGDNSIFDLMVIAFNTLGNFIFSIFEKTSANILFYLFIVGFKIDISIRKLFNQMRSYVLFDEKKKSALENYELYFNKVEKLLAKGKLKESKKHAVRDFYEFYLFALQNHLIAFNKNQRQKKLDNLILMNYIYYTKKQIIKICKLHGFDSKYIKERMNFIYSNIEAYKKKKIRMKLLWFYQKYLSFINKLLSELDVIYSAV